MLWGIRKREGTEACGARKSLAWKEMGLCLALKAEPDLKEVLGMDVNKLNPRKAPRYKT